MARDIQSDPYGGRNVRKKKQKVPEGCHEPLWAANALTVDVITWCPSWVGVNVRTYLLCRDCRMECPGGFEGYMAMFDIILIWFVGREASD